MSRGGREVECSGAPAGSELSQGKLGGQEGDILIVEDDYASKNLCEAVLEKAGFRVDSAMDCAGAREALARSQFRVLLLDLGLPDGDGFDLLDGLQPNQAVLIMTVRGEPEQRARGLRAGAVDYIVKPFHPDELLLRIRRVVSSSKEIEPAASQHEVSWGEFSLDKQRREFQAANGETIGLTAGEAEILARLLRRESIVTTALLSTAVARGLGSARSVSVLISRLRGKFRTTPGFKGIRITAIHGTGYQIEWRED